MENNTAVAVREQEETDALTRVKAWQVETAADFSALDSFLVSLSQLKNKIVADFKDSKEKAFAAHRAITAQEKGHLDKVEQAYREGKTKLVVWEEGEKRKTAAAQAIVDAEAETERKRTEALARIAEKKGDTEKAEALRTAAPPPAPRLEASVPQRSTSVQTRWGADVTDPLFVLKAVSAAIAILSKAKTPSGIKAHADLVQAEKDLAFMSYNTVVLNGQAKAGSPYVNGVLKLGGVTFSSRKV